MDEKVQSYFYEIQNKYIFPGKDNYDKKLLRMKNILDLINENVAYVQSDYTIYMHDFLKASYWEMKENYVQVKKVLMNLSRFIKSSPLPHIYKHRNINSIGECEIYLGNYQKAIQQFKKAKPFYSLTHKANYYYTLNYEFYPRFYLSQINESEKIVDELLQNAFPLHSEFHMGRYQYFKACIHYEKKEYKQALGILNSSLLLSKDKTGYDILIRVMRIKCLLETECYDQASDQVEVLRRHASRYKNKNYLSERNVIIIKILLLMDKRGFNGIPLSEEKELIKKITETSGLHAWKPLSPELIKFHEWYENFMQFR
jgi:tetratricopeptide (TPR) repeat protein